MQQRGRIDAAAEPDAQRHIGQQMLADGLLQQRVELARRRFHAPMRLRRRAWQPPIGSDRVLPVRHSSQYPGRSFSMPSTIVYGAGHVVQRQVAIQRRPGSDSARSPDARKWPSVRSRTTDRRRAAPRYSGLMPMRSRASTSRRARFRPQRDGEHAPQPGEAIQCPIREMPPEPLRCRCASEIGGRSRSSSRRNSAWL